MKKNHFWMFVTILLCGTMIMTSCSDKDNAAEPTTPEEQPSTPDEAAMPELKEDFESIADWVTAAVKRCHPHIREVWNEDADPADFNLLLTNESCDKVYFINADGKREVPQTEWDDDLVRGLGTVSSADYYFFTFQDKYSCLQIVSPEKWKTMEEVYKMAGRRLPTLKDNAYGLLHTFYHESFHNYVQRLRGWKKLEDAPFNRDQTYPVDYEPRICRKVALLALLQAWLDPSQKEAQYARAKYWTQKYEKLFPEEAAGIRETDIDESTAEYFCLNVIHAAFSDYQLLYELEGDLAADIDGESYQQSLAMQLIRRDGRLSEAMQAVKEEAVTPIQILLKNVAAPANYDESQDAADVQRVRAAMDKAYSKDNPLTAPVAELLERHLSGQAIYVCLQPQTLGHYYSSLGSYKLTDLPKHDCFIQYEATDEKVDINGCTLILYNNEYHFYPVATVEHLLLSDWQDISDQLPDLPQIAVTRQATLTDITDEPTFTLKILPTTVLYGKDKLGNEYYVCL